MDRHPDRAPDQFGDIIALLSPFASMPRNARRGLDWCLAYGFCEFHGVRPALARVLEEHVGGPPCPVWLTTQLANFQKRHAFAVMSTTAEIVSIAKALEAAGLAALFFKGAVLAQQVYGGAHLREFNDIDLLVNADEQEIAADLLKELGYQPIIADRLLRKTFFDYQGQHMFRNEATGSVVDLHWSLAGGLPFPISEDEALRDRTWLPLGGVSIPIHKPEVLALILAGHGQKEGWASFGWALDFARFAAKFPDFDWAHASRTAKSKGSLRSLLTAILLVEHLFGHTIDADLAILAGQDRIIVGDVERVLAKYDAGERRKLSEDLLGGLRLCETTIQRAKASLHLLTTRTIGDFEAMPLPPQWWWAYRFTRPFRLVWQKVRGGAPAASAFFAEQAKKSKR